MSRKERNVLARIERQSTVLPPRQIISKQKRVSGAIPPLYAME